MDEAAPSSGRLPAIFIQLQRRFQKALDDVTPYSTPRWIATVVLGLCYALRAYSAGGWYIVTYALGIYQLNLLLAFLTPKIDPAMGEDDDDDEEGGPALPTRQDEEFKPFIRRLPEFKFWFAATRAIIVAFLCTLFTVFDLPVFWPVLLVYFVVLFGITMKRQIMHMVKYKYVPFDFNKKHYKSSSDGKK